MRRTFRHPPDVFGSLVLYWIEDSLDQAALSKQSGEMIYRINELQRCHVISCRTISKCMRHLNRIQTYEKVALIIVTDKLDAFDFSAIRKYQQVQSIFLMNLSNGSMDPILSEKISSARVFTDYEMMFSSLQNLLDKFEQAPNTIKLKLFNTKGKSLRDVHKDLGPFVWSHSYTVLLMLMNCNTTAAKKQMLLECRRHPAYRSNKAQLEKISEFRRDYRPMDAIRWYTKETFLHNIINEALRTEDPQVLFIYRYFITDLCKLLEEERVLTRMRHQSPLCVYRGAIIDQNEIEKLCVGMLVSTNGFFSSSLSSEVAKAFIGMDPNIDMHSMSSTSDLDDSQSFVLFEIDIDLNESMELIVADISEQSYYPEEQEIIFGLGTTFVVKSIQHNSDKRIWCVRMTVSSEMCELQHDYTTQVKKSLTYFDATTLFGIYLSEMYGNHSAGIKYFQGYLRQMSFDDLNRAHVYNFLARVYRLMGKYPHAVEYFRRAQLLRKRLFSVNSYDYADTLADLAVTYSQSNNISKAIHLHEQAISIFKRILGPNDTDMPLYYTQLAHSYWQEKRYEKAHALLVIALSILDKDKNARFAGLPLTKHTMGLVKYAMGQREEAIDFLKQALELRQKLFANDHISVGRSYYDLARIYMEMNEEKTALEYAQAALTIYQAKLGKNHQDLQLTMDLVDQLLSLSTINISTQLHLTSDGNP